MGQITAAGKSVRLESLTCASFFLAEVITWTRS